MSNANPLLDTVTRGSDSSISNCSRSENTRKSKSRENKIHSWAKPPFWKGE